MGRHTKGMANMLALFQRAAEAERQWAAYAIALPDDDKRQLFRQWWAKAEAAQAAGRYVRRCPRYLRGLTCGARKKGGALCRSTGPRSLEGRARALENLKLGRVKRGKSWG